MNDEQCADCGHEFADGDEKFTWHRAYDMVAADRKETLCEECIDSWTWFQLGTTKGANK